MTPLRRLGDFFSSTAKENVVGEDANKKAGTRIVEETIESRVIDAGGAGYVIRGKFVKSSGQIIFQVGERVNVLFKEDEPIVILGHSWRKAQFEEEPIPAPALGTLEIISGGTIELPPKIDPETGLPEEDESGAPVPQFINRFIIFNGALQAAIEIPVEITGSFPEPFIPGVLGLRPERAIWGENGNHILLQFIERELVSPGGGPFGSSIEETDFLQVFKINRGVGSSKIPFKKDPEDETKIKFVRSEAGEVAPEVIVGTTPVVDGELLGVRIPPFDATLPLRRGAFVGTEPQKLFARENLIFRTFHDVEAFNEAKTVGKELGGPESALKEFLTGDTPWDSRTTETVVFEEEHEMTVDGFDIGGGAYNTSLIATILDGDNEIIQIYNISWNIGRFFSSFDEKNRKRVTVFAPSTPDDIMPTVSELLTAAGFLQPVGPGEPLDLPDIFQGNNIVRLGSGGGFGGQKAGPHDDAQGYDLGSLFFEPFGFLQIIPARTLFPRRGQPSAVTHFDVFALKRDKSPTPTEDKSVIVGASFEKELSLEYDREVDFPMGARMFIVSGQPAPVPGGHFDSLIFTRPGIAVSQSALGRSLVDDGTGDPNLLNFAGASQSGGDGPFYRTDELGGGCCPGGAPITIGADGIEDQIGILDSNLNQIFPQGFPQTFNTVHNVKFEGRFKFGDPELRPELPDVVKEEPVVVRRALGFLSTQISLLTNFEFFVFPGPGKITTPDSDVDINTFLFSFIEEHEPSFSSSGFSPITNKKAVLMVGRSRFGEDPTVSEDLPTKTRILRWDYTNEDDEFFVESPTQPFEERGPSIDPNVVGVLALLAHDGAIYLRWRGILSGGAIPAERIFIPSKPGEPEGAGDRTFTTSFMFPEQDKRPSVVAAVGFAFIRPGRGTTKRVQQSYSNVQGTGPEAERAKVRDRIYQITVNESDGRAETVKTTAPPNTDVRRLGVPLVRPFGAPDYHYAGVK